MATSSKKTKKLISFLFVLILALLIYFVYPYLQEMMGDYGYRGEPIPIGDGEYIEVHMIDVGQGDSILIRTAGGNMLIDAGPGKAEDDLQYYLDTIGVENIEYAVFTHPDEDHIGGADMIMKEYTVSNVIMPDKDPGTRAYERLEAAIDESGAKRILAEPGTEYTLSAMTVTVLGPLSEKYSATNNYSVVLKLEFGETTFMMTGDAEIKSEEEILSQYTMNFLDCDVLKVGHHGSDTSSSSAFLNAVTPEYALISCGTGNTYGHPDAGTLNKLEDRGAEIFRTDKLGTVILTSDGENIEIKNRQ